MTVIFFQIFIFGRSHDQNLMKLKIDQKSCLKSMLSIGLNVNVIEPKITDKGAVTDIELIENKISELGAENVLAIHTTISCFAPRQPDTIEAISKLSETHNIPHIINGAYFLQSKKSINLGTGVKMKLQTFFCIDSYQTANFCFGLTKSNCKI